ncbi:MAG: winged helix-turn-helix domain-containing protein, partial [Pseudomonadota bacterium]
MQTLRLSDREVDLETGHVSGPGVDEQLSSRLLLLLQHLVDHRGVVQSRDEILEAVWGHLEAASDDSLNVAISGLRKALGDSERPHRLVKTQPRRGYLYLGPEPVPRDDRPESERSDDPSAAVAPDATTRGRPWRLGGALALLVLLVLALSFLRPGEDGQGRPADGSSPPRVAVLPFEDFSPQGDQLGLANGLTDQLLHDLAQLPGLEVIARTSTYALQGQALTVEEIARRLDADVVLEGSIQRSDATVRVTAQLIDANSQAHLWSRTYDRAAGDILLIQEDVAGAVAQALSLTMLPTAPRSPLNLEVFERMALGRHGLDGRTLASLREAQGHFERVIELAPMHAAAHALLASSMAQIAGLEGRAQQARAQDPGFERFLALIRRAYELDPRDPDALRMRALLVTIEEGPEAALPVYRRAAELAPGMADTHGYLGHTLSRLGRYDEALDELRIAARLDPLNDTLTVWRSRQLV